MDGINKKIKLAAGTLAVVMNALTAAFAYSFISGLTLSFGIRWLIGFLVMASPMLTFWAVAALWKQESTNKKE